MKSAGKARNNGLYRHIRTSKEIIRNLLNDLINYMISSPTWRRKNFLTALWNRWTFTSRSSQIPEAHKVPFSSVFWRQGNTGTLLGQRKYR